MLAQPKRKNIIKITRKEHKEVIKEVIKEQQNPQAAKVVAAKYIDTALGTVNRAAGRIVNTSMSEEGLELVEEIKERLMKFLAMLEDE